MRSRAGSVSGVSVGITGDKGLSAIFAALLARDEALAL
jgi:hypothetical protein